ncbi:MAG: outer membrane lipoprotein-sorting protein [Bacteroidales bacterium]
MKKSTTFFTVLFLIAGNSMMSQSLDDILKEHFSAIGQDNILKVNTQKLTGKMLQGGIEIPFTQMAKRPEKIRIEGTFQGLTFIQTFNGMEGWMLNPFTGVTDPQPMSEDDLKGMRYQADMDGMLWNWKEKGYTVAFDGKEDMEGTSCFKIKLDTKEGDSFTYYIDADSYLMLRTNSKMKVMENETESDTYYSNYTMVEGMAVPGKIETKMKEQLVATLIIDKVELNTELDDALFEKPVN